MTDLKLSGAVEADQRVQDLVERMTLEEKLAQIVGFWEKSDGEAVAPLQGEFTVERTLDEASRHGLGHLTRVYGTRPVDPASRARWLWAFQRRLVRETRMGIPALVHEECLTGLSAWRAATFPTPLAWGASFDPELVTQMGAAIGGSMRALGVHQGLAPVLDVIRDPRWGRVDECIGEDPYLVGTVGTSYVRGLQSTGVHATLKHFVGYSASQSGRNFGPVHAGPREVADVLLPPFEMAVRDGGVRSVMSSYTELDGIPTASDPSILTGILRDRWGFDGTVVADYFGVAFLQLLHHVAGDLGEAAGLALAAGVDIELPAGDAYLEPLAEAVRDGKVDEALVDRAVTRALLQKAELGLLDATFDDEPPTDVELDTPEHRRIALRLAEESVVLLSNDGTLPLRQGVRVAVIGPNADRPEAMFGCYSFVNHVLPHHPEVGVGIEVPTLRQALAAELGSASVLSARGCAVDDDDRSGFDDAVRVATEADVAVLVLGDHAGLFGRGTVGEGCDRDDLELPGVQRELAEAVLATGKPVVLVLLTGRPYAVGWAVERCAAVVQSFFPGEEGGPALAGVLSGRVNPSGRLPVSLPRSAGAQPYTYLHPALGGDGDVTNLSTRPVLPFGHGLSYTTFTHTDLAVEPITTTDGPLVVTVRVTNTGERGGDDVVQLYGRDVVASVTRPVAQLLGYQRVHLERGQTAVVELVVPAARLAFTDRTGERVVEPGDLELWVGPSCAERETQTRVTLTGGVHRITADDARWTSSVVR
ncbi:glycoside hydrolase family 3 N-terminal domain-containing protein [Cellulomonas fimi]|uniref:Glycoside hydrolase family 3 domain protein n=1 Tax=Cellulomonas fimi (strain ATCC 484 / DSM 20113 / JCM 1341 / CCUG 24087 / LMG 16345 / NBRC 15513 / NCIMB 8980 / NCTC 7547 / NRS-133) TaxID=590998 RepID=F4H6T9_CELFA|nr:glycoside hydrolase family 3 domain protein [Cellulomonas fimi ATCC 484]VEH34360.1 Periplasmic beta-glucosidase precursor [Cellulomonas fimi]